MIEVLKPSLCPEKMACIACYSEWNTTVVNIWKSSRHWCNAIQMMCFSTEVWKSTAILLKIYCCCLFPWMWWNAKLKLFVWGVCKSTKSANFSQGFYSWLQYVVDYCYHSFHIFPILLLVYYVHIDWAGGPDGNTFKSSSWYLDLMQHSQCFLASINFLSGLA